MGDVSSTTSDDDAPPRRRSSRLSASRGVVKREEWATSSGTESDSGSETEMEETRDDSEDLPLAQREEASSSSDSDDETEDDGVVVKRSIEVHIKREVVEEEESDEEESSDSDDEEEVKSESGEGNESVESDSDTVKSEGEASSPVASASTKEEEDAHLAEQIASSMLRSVDEEDVEGVDYVLDRSDKVDDGDDEAEADGKDGEEGEDDNVAEEDEEEEEIEEREHEDEVGERRRSRALFTDAKNVVRQISSNHLTFGEFVALSAGKRVVGPPIDRAISQADQWKRKYRWPVGLRNVRRRKFNANAEELAELHEVELNKGSLPLPGVSTVAQRAFAAALAPTARPLMEAAVVAHRQHYEQREQDKNFVERLEESKDTESKSIDLARLRTLTRIGGHYTDQLLDSILTKVVLGLQGIDESYAQQSWDPLPGSKRPIANWRFVLEHFCRTSTHGVDASAIMAAPRLRKDTLIRIRDRLRKLYGVAWRPEDDEFFNLVDQQEMDPPDFDEIIEL